MSQIYSHGLYTSGTTGIPKAVRHTHLSLSVAIDTFLNAELFRLPMSMTGFLPFAHIYPLLALLVAAAGGHRIVLAAESGPRTRKVLSNWIAAIHEGAPELVIAVPQLIEKLVTGALQKLAAPLPEGSSTSEVQQQLVARAAFAAGIIEYRKKTAAFRDPNTGYLPAELPPVPFEDALTFFSGYEDDSALQTLMASARHRLATAIFGPEVRWIATGGSGISYEMNEQVEGGLGLPLLNGYGLTETFPVIAAMPGSGRIPCSVGMFLPSTGEAWIDPSNSELIIAGDTLASEYFGDPEKTARAFFVREDGVRCYRTGDVFRRIDLTEGRYGFVFIGRIDRQYANKGGVNIIPEETEKHISHPFIAYCVVWGLDKATNAAIISPSEVAKAWCQDHGVAFEALNDCAEFRGLLLEYFAQSVNPKVPEVNKVTKVLVVPPFTVEEGLITASGKVSGKKVIARYEAELESLF